MPAGVRVLNHVEEVEQKIKDTDSLYRMHKMQEVMTSIMCEEDDQ